MLTVWNSVIVRYKAETSDGVRGVEIALADGAGRISRGDSHSLDMAPGAMCAVSQARLESLSSLYISHHPFSILFA